MLRLINAKEVMCKTAIGKCGFPDGGMAINPFVGCGHNCSYCYARFMRRFSGHDEKWGTFVDVRVNIADVLDKQLQNPKYRNEHIYIGTVTDPYQPSEGKYGVTRKILELLKGRENSISILTKSDLVLRDLDLIKQTKNIDINISVSTLDEKWRGLSEPFSSSIEDRFRAMDELSREGVRVNAMVGPYWPHFTDISQLFKRFKESGVTFVFSESFNATGGNWTEVDRILAKHYPELHLNIKEVFFNNDNFNEFYGKADNEIARLSEVFSIPSRTFFGIGHGAKFPRNNN